MWPCSLGVVLSVKFLYERFFDGTPLLRENRDTHRNSGKETTRTYVDENNKIHWSETGERIGVFYAKESDAGVLRYATTADAIR